MKHKKELTHTESRTRCLLLMDILILAGVTAGAFLAAFRGTDELWLHQRFSPIYSGNTLLEVFGNTFLISGMFLAAEFLFGFFSCGQPVGLALLVFRGFGIGAAVAQMYMSGGFGAVVPVLVLVVPKALAVSFVTALGAREMLKMSNVQFRFLFRDELPDEKISRAVKLYFIKFIVLLLLILFIAMADSALNYIFIDLYQS